ncbi:hypothetical protein K440DRAFT_664416 [Wilcoxina mikolae CBS 423.85]|nr:hypothetical protein K440DRAFT_664416 [Wilcoxina mikolae CBS 423.85]
MASAPPTVPPRPARAKSPNPSIPAIPPRPAGRAKSPGTDNASSEQEPTIKTIPSSTELHAPVALPSRPAAVPKTESEHSSTPTTPRTPSFNKTPTDDREKDGIPQIGRRVPMYPNAGDVQAPTPSETPSSNRKKHVYREEWEMNEGAYGTKRRETPYSMSSTDLNAVVAQSASPAVGVNENECGVPDEELGYIASDHYTQALSRTQSRSHSPVHHKRDSARTSFDGHGGVVETDEHGDVIHLEDPEHGPGYFRRGNSSYAASRAESIHEGEEADEEKGQGQYSILAEDEVLKRQQGQYMQAAVYTPTYTPRHPRSRPHSSLKEHRDDVEGASLELSTKFKESSTALRTPYEELSPADENAKPLFPESDDEKEEPPKNPAVEKLKRPGLPEHRFPSNDVWEEAPDHAQLEATIESLPTGQVAAVAEEDDEEEPQKKKSDEPVLRYISGQPHEHYQPGDEQEYERKQKDAARKATDYRLDLQNLPEDDDRLRRLHKNVTIDDQPDNSSNNRRGARRGFPSNDIWEDVPPSLDLEEELEPSPLPEKNRASTGDISAIPATSTRPTTSAPIEGPSTMKPTPPPRPSVPARPLREKKWSPATIPEQPEPSAASDKKSSPPSVPDRPKPSVPARPGKLAARTPSEEKQAAPEPKPKPPVPPRTGGKIAALKAGLGDLESRLRLGPLAPPPKKEEKKEEEEEPAKEEPLTDVRKSRARGPRGRKLPTKEEKPVTAAPTAEQLLQSSEIVGVWTVFTLDEDLDAVLVNTTTEKPSPYSAPAPEVYMRKDDELATETVVEKQEETPVATTTTTTLPGVSGTGEQTVPATQAEPTQDPDPESAETDNPTAIPSSQHPEDAVEESFEEVEKPSTPELK